MTWSAETSLPVTVYGLSSSHDGQIRYVGQTTAALTARLKSHFTGARHRSWKPVSRWIVDVQEAGHKVHIQCLAEDAIWDQTERDFIRKYKQLGVPLVNANDGGGGHSWSLESRAKASSSSKGKKKSHDHCISLSKALSGRRLSPEHVEKLSAALKGRIPKNLKALHEAKKSVPRSAETRKKISISLRGRPVTDKHRAHLQKISEANSWRKLHISDARRTQLINQIREVMSRDGMRARIALSLKGRKLSPESIAKRTANRDYHLVSDESRRRTSERVTVWWASKRGESRVV